MVRYNNHETCVYLMNTKSIKMTYRTTDIITQ